MDIQPAFDCIHYELQLVEDKLLQAIEIEYEPLNEMLRGLFCSGGKRLRPALALLAAKLCTVPNVTAVVTLAAAVEMLHTATLVHDDLIDGALLRRGISTLSAKLSASATVLAGDYLFSRAAAMAAETENLRVVTIFARTLRTICDGELQQTLASHNNWQQSKEDYYRRIYAKTASLFAAACESGAILANAPEAEIQALRAYGCHLGMAFQIVDDILDLIGNEQEMGKPIGSDLRQGTITLPVFYYLQNRSQQEMSLLRLAEGEERDKAIRMLVERIKASSAPDAALAEAKQFAAQAKAVLQGLPSTQYRCVMADLADYVVKRKH